MEASEAFTAPRRARWEIVAAFVALLVAGVLGAGTSAPVVAGLAVVAALATALALRQPQILLGLWFAATPWAAYMLKFPEERSIVTFDRVVVTAIVVGFAARVWRRQGRLPGLTLFEIASLCFAIVAGVSALALSNEKGLAFKITVDAFALPVALFYALRTGFEPERDRRALFWGVLALALALPWIGVAEFVTARDLMPFKGASIFRTGIVRANGPFQTDNSYAIIGALVGVFLYWLPSVLSLRLDRTSRWAWWAGQATAYLAALVPIFRAIIGAIAMALALPAVLARRSQLLARIALVAILALLAATPVLIPLSRTATFRDRISDPSSAFSRAATYLAALDVIEDHPISGIGLTNYHTYFEAKFGTAWYIDVEAVANVGAESYPHNNVLGFWAELGVFGVLFYLLAAIALAGEAWRRRSHAALALMVVYWVPGMFLQSAVYADLNLYYLCMLGVLFAGPALDAE